MVTKRELMRAIVVLENLASGRTVIDEQVFSAAKLGAKSLYDILKIIGLMEESPGFRKEITYNINGTLLGEVE